MTWKDQKNWDAVNLCKQYSVWLNQPPKKVTGGQRHSFIKLIWAGNNCDAPPRRSECTRGRAAVLNRFMQNKSTAQRIGRGRGSRASGLKASAGGCQLNGIMPCRWATWKILYVRSVTVLKIFPIHLQDSPLILQSDRNVTVNARNDQGQLTGQLTVGKTNTRFANTAVYDCSMLQTLSIKSKLDLFIPDSHLCCFACAWILKCVFTAFYEQTKCYPFPLVHLTEADCCDLVLAKSFFQAFIELARAPCSTVNVIQRTRDICF